MVARISRVMSDGAVRLVVWLCIGVAVLSATSTPAIVWNASYSIHPVWPLLLSYTIAFGLYRRSRLCALILLVSHLYTSIGFLDRTTNVRSVLEVVTVAVLYVGGVLATFAYQGRRGLPVLGRPAEMSRDSS
jgi:hypothetical protein